MKTKGGRARFLLCNQASATNLGPTPAGSPMVTMIGGKLVIFAAIQALLIINNGVALEVPKIASSHHGDALGFELLLDTCGGRQCGLRH